MGCNLIRLETLEDFIVIVCTTAFGTVQYLSGQ